MSTPRANIEVLPRSVQFALGLGLAALLLFPVVGSDFYVQMVTRMMIMAIFAMSLDLLQGVTGLVSLGHAAYFGVAGYALAFLTPADTTGEPVVDTAAGRGGLRVGGLDHRILRRSHPRHLLHHGHHGVRADGVLSVL